LESGLINTLPVLRSDELNEAICLLLEFALCDEFAEMDPATQCVEAVDVAYRSTAIVLLGLSAIGSTKIKASFGQNLLGVLLLDGIVDVDIIVMEDIGVFERAQHGTL
jgi:hypothetical protein